MAPAEIAELVANMNDHDFEAYALNILGRELGAYGLARFIRLYRSGSGDYTRDRHQWQDGLSVEDVISQL